MNQERCTDLLTEHGIKPTANRLMVARELAAAGRPLSLSELERQLQTIDKSGIFRALTLFREHHLLHVIEDGSDGVRYELCMSHHHDHDDDMHAHFYCEHCHKTFCIDNVPVPGIRLPEGYQALSVNYVVKGLCPDCHHKLM